MNLHIGNFTWVLIGFPNTWTPSFKKYSFSTYRYILININFLVSPSPSPSSLQKKNPFPTSTLIHSVPLSHFPPRWDLGSETDEKFVWLPNQTGRWPQMEQSRWTWTSRGRLNNQYSHWRGRDNCMLLIWCLNIIKWKKEWASSHTPRSNIAWECCMNGNSKH